MSLVFFRRKIFVTCDMPLNEKQATFPPAETTVEPADTAADSGTLTNEPTALPVSSSADAILSFSSAEASPALLVMLGQMSTQKVSLTSE